MDEHQTAVDGRFAFEQIPFGQYRLAVTTSDGRTETQDIRISSGEVMRTEVFVPVAMSEVVVNVPEPMAPVPSKAAASASNLEREDIKELPRGDSASVNDVLATQSGFVFDAFGNLFARGNHANIQYQLDGVPLPDTVSGLFGGFLSPKFIENMEIITGGMGAEYGDRLAAVVNLNSRKPSEAGEGEMELVYGSFGTVNPSALYGKRIGKLSFLLAGSYRYTDRGLDPPAISPIIGDSGNEERAFTAIDYDLSDRDHFLLLGNFSRNECGIPVDPTLHPCVGSPAEGCGRSPDQFGNPPPPFFPLDTRSTETERDVFTLLSFRHDYSARTSLRLTGYYRNSYGSLFGDAQHALGPTQDPCTDPADPTTCKNASDVTRRANHVGGTAEYLTRIGEAHVVRIGANFDQLFGQDQFTQYTRSDVLQAPDPSLAVSGSDTSHATTGGAYISDRATFGKLTFDGGLRFDVQKVSFVGTPDQATQTGVSPRIGVAYAATPTTVAHAFFGLMWQPPPVLDTPAAARILGAVPPNQPVVFDLRPEKDRYAEIGIESRVLPALTLKLTTWGRLATDQLDDVEVGNTNLVSPYNFRDGRALGVEAGGIVVLSRWLSAFGNMSWETAEGRGIATAQYLFSPADLANNNWQTLDHSQSWTANGGVTIRDGASRISTLFNYGSGLRTGPSNNEHVPDHARVDLTLAHQFSSVALRPTIALDVINLFDAHYACRIANGFNGTHFAPERSFYLRLSTSI